MPAPHPVECPVCFETLKLKAAPRPGARLKCPHCSTVFSPGGDDEPASVEADDEDDVPVRSSRPKARGKASKGKKKQKPVNLVLPIILGVLALVVVGGGIGLYAARDSLAKLFSPGVDLRYCQLPVRSMAIEFKIQEFLNSPAVTDKIRNGPSFGESSAGLKALLGVEMADLTLMQAQVHLPTGVMGPMPPRDAMLILRSSKAFTPPTTGVYEIEGVTCYRLEDGGARNDVRMETMFLSGKTAAIIGREESIRGMLSNWKKKTLPMNPPLRSNDETVFVSFDQLTVVGTLGNISRMMSGNPLLGGAAGGPAQELQTSVTALGAMTNGFSVGGQLNGSQVAWTAAFHTSHAATPQNLQTTVDGIRAKLSTPIDAALAAGALLPPDTVKSMQIVKQALSTPLNVGSDRVSLAIPIPADQQEKSVESLAGLIPPLKHLKASTTVPTPGTPASPAVAP